MTSYLYSRRIFHSALAVVLLFAFCAMGPAQPVSMSRVGQAPRPAANAQHPAQGSKTLGPKPNQEHLAQWMERHNNLPLSDQQRALESEPGFRDLPPQTQQRMRDRLTQLNSMPPEQRRRILEHTEQMEHLSPPQRQQVRGAFCWRQCFHNMHEGERDVLAEAFPDIF